MAGRSQRLEVTMGDSGAAAVLRTPGFTQAINVVQKMGWAKAQPNRCFIRGLTTDLWTRSGSMAAGLKPGDLR